MSLDRTLQRVWYERAPFVLFLLLLPLSALFAIISYARRFAYRMEWFGIERMTRPVLVVGNISVGGTGKTPLVIWIAEYCASRGCKLGIVTRGYGGRAEQWPQEVTANSSADHVGDEAVLLALRTQAIVVAGPDRVAAASRAIARGAQLIVSDDGLQHYRLARDAEVVVLDAQRQLGNGCLLPAGPLREPMSRLQHVDLIVRSVRSQSIQASSAQHIDARHELGDAFNLVSGERRPLQEFTGRTVHALAGIGNPEAFFAMLKARGLAIDARALPDHAALQPRDIAFEDDAPVLMTEKDAVKCRAFANEQHWSVPLIVRFSAEDEAKLTALLDKLIATSTHSFAAPVTT